MVPIFENTVTKWAFSRQILHFVVWYPFEDNVYLLYKWITILWIKTYKNGYVAHLFLSRSKYWWSPSSKVSLVRHIEYKCKKKWMRIACEHGQANFFVGWCNQNPFKTQYDIKAFHQYHRRLTMIKVTSRGIAYMVNNCVRRVS